MKIKIYLKIISLIITLSSIVYPQGAYFVGINFPYISISGNEVKLNSAIGGGLNFQYKINDKFSITAIICAARHDMNDNVLILTKSNSSEIFMSSKWTLGWILGGVQYYPFDSSFIKPFVNGEAGFSFLSADFDNMLNGFALGGGLGLEHYFSEHWLISAGTNVRYTYLNSGTIGGESVKMNNPLDQIAITADLKLSYRF